MLIKEIEIIYCPDLSESNKKDTRLAKYNTMTITKQYNAKLCDYCKMYNEQCVKRCKFCQAPIRQ